MFAAMTTPPAQASDDATLLVNPRWGSTGGGAPLVTDPDGQGIIVGHGLPVALGIICIGDTACDPSRQARVEVMKDGSWVTWSTKTLAQTVENPKWLKSARTVSLIFRPMLPAYDGLSEIIGPEYSVRYLPRTTARASGTAYIPPSRANGFSPQFKAGRGSIVVRVTPAAPGRTLQVRDVGVEGAPLIATVTTNARGRATVRADFTGVNALSITVVPTAKRAGWRIYADAAVPAPLSEVVDGPTNRSGALLRLGAALRAS
jgi:hypothetical protein